MKAAGTLAVLSLILNVAGFGQTDRRLRESVKTAHSLADVLASAAVSGSLQYKGNCGPGVLVPQLPTVLDPQNPYAPNAVDTLRYMFSVDPEIVVLQEQNRIIRIVEAGIQTDILNIRIKHLSFNRISDPDEALGIVRDAPEVRSFLVTNRIGEPPWNGHPPLYLLPSANNSKRKNLSNPDMPSVSGELTDVRLADALDYILKTFPGFWLYQDCKAPDGQRVVYFGLFPVPGKIWTWE